MKTIREAAGEDIVILGCGCPVAGGIGWVDTMRVSADAGPSWFPDQPWRYDKTNMPAGRNMVRNSLTRLTCHNRWWSNDPDCMLIREATKLSINELRGIATVVALTGGPFVVSDNLSNVGEDRLRMIRSLLPVTGVAARPVDILTSEMPEILELKRSNASAGQWTILALCNWADKTKVR